MLTVSRQVAEFLAGNRVREVYAVRVGENAVRHLNRQNISVHEVQSGLTVEQVIQSIIRSVDD